MSLAEELSLRTLTRVVDGIGASEELGTDGGPVLLARAEGSTGTMRVFHAPDGTTVVTTKLDVPARNSVTCMVFAFSPPDSALPHFTLDCSDRPDGHAFHLDLMPRVELASHLAYMDEVFEPLSAAYAEGAAIEGLSATGTTRRQIAMMSPWMLVQLADEPAFRAITPIVDAYADHWLAVRRAGLSDAVLATVGDTDLAARDAAVRANLFHPSVDPVWGRVTAMLGAEASEAIQHRLLEGAG